MRLQDILKNFDQFGSMFQFQMGVGKQTRKTYFGAILSIALVFIAITYFIYLNYMFFSDLITPKITQSEKKIDKTLSMEIKPTLISFDIFDSDDDVSLKQREIDQGVSYITYDVTLTYMDVVTQKQNSIQIPTKFCKDLLSQSDLKEIHEDAQCLDFTSIPDAQRKMIYYPKSGIDSSINIVIHQCIGQPQCAASNDMDTYLYGENAEFLVTFVLEQFDTEQGLMIEKNIDMYWDFDSTLSTSTSVTLSTTNAQVKDGFLIPTNTNYLFFSDLVSSDSFKVKNTPKTDLSQVATFTLKLSGRQYSEIVQYAQYPEILAQFGSILNVLFLVGFIGKIVSKSDIQQYLIDQRLKEYYKRNAYQIIKKDQLSSKSDANNQNATQILNAVKQIEEKDLNQELMKTFKISNIEKIMKLLKAEDKEALMKKKRSERDIYDVLYFDATKSCDIFQLQSEMLRMRKIISMLITPEQYAAIKCCGTSIQDQIPYILDQKIVSRDRNFKIASMDDKEGMMKITEKAKEIEVQKNLDHLEQIDKIDYDNEFLFQKLEAFLKGSEQGFNQESQHNQLLNQRFYKCLTKTYNLQGNNDNQEKQIIQDLQEIGNDSYTKN